MEWIAKKYRVMKSLGQGAMGEVFLVLPPKGDPVALKLLKNIEGSAGAEAIEQFENEFKVLKRLSHPNIGRIIDYGFDEDLKKVFFTLPWLKGTDIYSASKELDFEKVEELFVQVLRALNYLHQKKLIHCDLKPGNIYVEDGEAVLIDFGLAGYFGENIVGTPTYLAPEVFRSGRHTVASDLYAAAVIIYNCLTRTQPFSGKDIKEVFNRHKTFTPPSISDVNPKVPKYFSDIIANLLNKKPEERFPSASSVIEEIDTYSKNSYSVETDQTLLSYLPTQSEMIGREDVLEDTKAALKSFVSKHVDTPYHLILISGMKNVGKARLVSKIKNELQLSKTTVENITTPLTDTDQNVIMSSSALILENISDYFHSADEIMNFRDVMNLIEQKSLSTETDSFLMIASSERKEDFESLLKIFPSEESNVTEVSLQPYSQKNTEEFLQKIIGQDEIPQNFVERFHRDTQGLPGIAEQLIQSMIENGLLFDKSGRWSEDLLTSLNQAFDKLTVSESLEQEFEKIFAELTDQEEEIIKWMCLCPHPLTVTHLLNLTRLTDLSQIMHGMIEKQLIKEDHKEYTIYRSVFQNFIKENLHPNEVAKRHTILAQPKIGLDKKWSIYHLSHGHDQELKLRALKKLAEIYQQEGEREKALHVFLDLIQNDHYTSFEEKLDWNIEAVSLLIWLDKFEEASHIIENIEAEIESKKPKIMHSKYMTLIEKKGLVLLHQQQLEDAKAYFQNGLKLAKKYDDCKVQQIRFENDLAEIELWSGHMDQAIENFKKTRELAKNLSNQQLQEITNNDLGHVYLQQQKFDESIPYLKEDIRIFNNMKNREPLARALYSFAEALRSLKQYDKATVAYQECVNICKQGHYHNLLLRAYNGLGNMYLSQDDQEHALENYQKAIDISVRLKQTATKAAMLYNQGFIYKSQDNKAMASRRFLMAKQVLENKGSQLLAYEETLLSRCYKELATLAIEEHNSMKALNYQLERLKVIRDSVTMVAEKFDVRLDLAELYLENRLNDQFLDEIHELEAQATTPEQKEKVQNLHQKYKSIDVNEDQDATGRIEIRPEGT